MNKIFSLIFVIMGILFLDIATKYWVHTHLLVMGQWGTSSYPFGGIEMFSHWLGIDFALVHATNTGAAYSLFSQFPMILLSIRIVLILFLSLYLVFRSHYGFFVNLPIALILTGAIGNVVDTFAYGHVVDMFQFIFFGYPFAIFNVADAAISLGIGWLLATSLFAKEKPSCRNI